MVIAQVILGVPVKIESSLEFSERASINLFNRHFLLAQGISTVTTSSMNGAHLLISLRIIEPWMLTKWGSASVG